MGSQTFPAPVTSKKRHWLIRSAVGLGAGAVLADAVMWFRPDETGLGPARLGLCLAAVLMGAGGAGLTIAALRRRRSVAGMVLLIGCLVAILPAALVLGLALLLMPSHTYTDIDQNWQIMWEHSAIAEAGGHHPFLFRNSKKVHVMVDRDTYEYEVLGDDCVAWVGLDSGGLYAACGDRTPVLLSEWDLVGDLRVDSSAISRVYGTETQFSIPLALAKQRAMSQPELTNQWRAEDLSAR